MIVNCSALLALKQNEDVRRVAVSRTKRGAAIHSCQYSVTLSHRRKVFPHAPSLLTLLSITTKMPSVVEQRWLLVRAEEFQGVAWRVLFPKAISCVHAWQISGVAPQRQVNPEVHSQSTPSRPQINVRSATVILQPRSAVGDLGLVYVCGCAKSTWPRPTLNNTNTNNTKMKLGTYVRTYVFVWKVGRQQRKQRNT